MVKANRCDECRRRKKRCAMAPDGGRCDYCSKKGIPCVMNEEGLQIVHYNPDDELAALEGRYTIEVSSRRSSDSGKTKRSSIGNIFVDGVSITKPKRRPSIQNNPLQDPEEVTASSLISVINKVKTNYQPITAKVCNQTFGFTNMAKVYLPHQNVSIMSNIDGPVLTDELIRSSVPETLKIPEHISLVDFLFSSTRINNLDASTDDPSKLLSLALGEIKTFLENDKQSGDVIEVLRDRGYLVSTENGEDDSHFEFEKRRMSENTKRATIEEFDFTIDVSNLSQNYFVEKAGITLEDGRRKFCCDVVGDGTFNDVICSVLFDHFCAITPIDPKIVEAGTPDEKMPTPTDTSPKSSKSYLSVVLPLIAGNATVLKAAMLLGYHHWMIANPDDMMNVIRDDMDLLYLDVLNELKDRLSNQTSLCCDHTIMCTILLLNVELMKGMRGSLWSKLLDLMHSLIKFRGGPRELATSLTGLCLLRTVSSHLCMGMLTFKPESIETHEVVNLIEFSHILDTKPLFQFYDMINFRPDFCCCDIKEILRTYANVFQLHNLSGISYFANTKGTPQFGDYDTMSTQNLEYAVSQAEKLAKTIDKILTDMNIAHLPHKYRVQYAFSIRTAVLCIYQSVYRFNSLTPKTVLCVKKLLADVEVMFEALFTLQEDELKETMVFVYPLFCLGVDIVSEKRREWYLANLEELFRRSKKQCIATCIELLKKIWEVNVDGMTFVDPKVFSLKSMVLLPFFV